MLGKQGLGCLIAEAKGKGFRQVLTAGGWIDLDAWRPYGDCLPTIEFASWYIFRDRIYERTESDMVPGMAYGVWTLGHKVA